MRIKIITSFIIVGILSFSLYANSVVDKNKSVLLDISLSNTRIEKIRAEQNLAESNEKLEIIQNMYIHARTVFSEQYPDADATIIFPPLPSEVEEDTANTSDEPETDGKAG